MSSEPQGPHSKLSDKPGVIFAPGSYRGPQRRNPELVDANKLSEQLRKGKS